jgi:hypothetical protein
MNASHQQNKAARRPHKLAGKRRIIELEFQMAEKQGVPVRLVAAQRDQVERRISQLQSIQEAP